MRESPAGGYAALAQLVGGRSDEVALFGNSTHAWNAAFYSIPLGPGDRILTGRDEYGSNVLAYLQVARRSGAEIVVVPDDGDGQIDLGALTGLVDERTKLIGLTWVPASGGLVNPAAAVGRIARDAGALYLLDATQAVGQFPVDVHDVGCDLRITPPSCLAAALACQWSRTSRRPATPAERPSQAGLHHRQPLTIHDL